MSLWERAKEYNKKHRILERADRAAPGALLATWVGSNIVNRHLSGRHGRYSRGARRARQVRDAAMLGFFAHGAYKAANRPLTSPKGYALAEVANGYLFGDPSARWLSILAGRSSKAVGRNTFARRMKAKAIRAMRTDPVHRKDVREFYAAKRGWGKYAASHAQAQRALAERRKAINKGIEKATRLGVRAHNFLNYPEMPARDDRAWGRPWNDEVNVKKRLLEWAKGG